MTSHTDSTILNVSTTPITIHTVNNNGPYRTNNVSNTQPTKECVFKDSPTSSINFKPVNITFSNKRKDKYDVIDVNNMKSTEDIDNIINIYSHHRHYRNSPSHNYKSEIFGTCKWCLFCLSALGLCIIFVSHLLEITGSASQRNNLLPHHMDTHYGYHQIEGSVANSYMNRKSSHHIKSFSSRIPIQMNDEHQYDIHHLNIISVNTKKQINNRYHLVRNDKYSILNDILFLVFKSSINDDGMDGREVIKRTWSSKYKGLYDINIKFVNTGSHKFETDDDDNIFDDVIEAPFIGDSAMCLLWALDEYTDGYQWIFKVDDVTFVMIENVVDYLNEIELESSLLKQKNNEEDDYYWWLGNRLQQKANDENTIFTSGGAGYILNRAILDLIVNDIRSYDENDKYMMCKQQDITWEDHCIGYLLNVKYNIHSTVTLDKDNNEKFNVWDPFTLFGYDGVYKLPMDWYSKYKDNIGEELQKEGTDYMSKTPITFHYISSEWMDAYYELLYLHKKAQDIDVISSHIGSNKDKKIREEQLKNLNDYAQIVTQYSLTNNIKNIHNEMQYITKHINYKLVK